MFRSGGRGNLQQFGQLCCRQLVLGEKAGLDWRSMLAVFENSAVASPLVRAKVPALAVRDVAPGAATGQMTPPSDSLRTYGGEKCDVRKRSPDHGRASTGWDSRY